MEGTIRTRRLGRYGHAERQGNRLARLVDARALKPGSRDWAAPAPVGAASETAFFVSKQKRDDSEYFRAVPFLFVNVRTLIRRGTIARPATARLRGVGLAHRQEAGRRDDSTSRDKYVLYYGSSFH